MLDWLESPEISCLDFSKRLLARVAPPGALKHIVEMV